MTRNEDVTYKARVRKIIRSYGSFIQKMVGEFNCDGYQIVQINTFVEMLGIRDTIQSPVLMSENKDETMTRFYIPTSTKLLYVYELKVDNYDKIYGTDDDTDPDDTDPDGGCPSGNNGGLVDIFYLGVKFGIYPSLIFMGVGAMTDFTSLIANPKTILLGAAPPPCPCSWSGYSRPAS